MLVIHHAFRRLGIPLLLGLKTPSAYASLNRAPAVHLRLSSTLQNNEEIPDDFPRRKDVVIALDAVRQACRVTSRLQPLGKEDEGGEKQIATVEKADLSPVTVADYAVQALILHLIQGQFPRDGFIAEEDSAALLENESLLQQVLSASGLDDKESMLHALDLGRSYTKWNEVDGKSSRPSRVWALDPIDGTRGFLRGKLIGGQYAVALALLEDGEPVVGVLGCPNLPSGFDDEEYAWSKEETEDNNLSRRGCVFVASRGGGCYQLPLYPGASPSRRLQVTKEETLRNCRFCIGVEKFSDHLGQTPKMAKILHGGEEALDSEGGIRLARRIDSQAKHGVISRGGAEWYVRLPKPGYQEWIWDHAAGNVVVEEAGGQMTDEKGRQLDFSLGSKLSAEVRGILMSNGLTHKALVDAFAQVDQTG